MDNMIMIDKRQILDDATVLRKQDRFEEAIVLFEPIWVEHRGSMTEWDCWSFALCLRKTGQVQEALDLCSFVHETNPKIKINNDEYARCIYELEIKGLRPTEVTQQEGKFLSAVQKIVQLTKQDRYSPFERAVMACLRYLNSKQNIPYAQVIEWTDRLDPSQLQSVSLIYEGQDGKQYELPSYKENWYSYRTKALDKLKRYEECLALSQEALETLSEFHYDNDAWFHWRIGKSMYSLGRISEAIEILESDKKLQKEWYAQHLLSKAYFDIKNIEKSFQYAAEAALNHGERKNKYRLFLHMAELYETRQDVELAHRHIELALVAHAEQPTDRLPGKLNQAMRKYDISEIPQSSTRDLFNSLRPVWQAIKLADLPSATGTIVKVLPHGKAGFIKAEDGASHYFSTKSFQGKAKEIKQGLPVKFHIKPSYDPRKEQESTEAVHIISLD